MRTRAVLVLVAVFVFAFSGMAQALMVDTYDWVGEGSTPLARVTTVYYSAAEISGSSLDLTPGINDNLFLYSVQNLSDGGSIQEFGVSNPDNVSAVMFNPSGWASEMQDHAYRWETESAYIAPGDTLSGFVLLAMGDRGVRTAPPYNVNQIGSIEFIDGESGEFEVFGPVTGPVAVPEPGSLMILGSGLLVIPLLRRRFS